MKKGTPQYVLYNMVIKLPRRLRFVISSLIMTILILTATFFDFQMFWIFVPVLILVGYITTYFAVLEGISRNETYLLFIVPIAFSIATYLFYFLFPVRWLTRVPLIIFYGMSIYAILLTSNIFNVGVEKNIQLYRAAFSVNYLFQTLMIFLISEVLLSFRLFFLLNAGIIFLVLFGLGIQLLWSVQPQDKLERTVLFHAAIMSLIITQVILVFSFLPLRSTIFSLLVTTSYYSIGGLFYHYLDNKLFKQTIREHIVVMIVVLVIILLTIPW